MLSCRVGRSGKALSFPSAGSQRERRFLGALGKARDESLTELARLLHDEFALSCTMETSFDDDIRCMRKISLRLLMLCSFRGRNVLAVVLAMIVRPG